MDIGPRTFDQLLALPERNQRGLALLGPRSVDQRQGLLCPIAKVEIEAYGPPHPCSRAPRLGPRAFSISVVNSFGDNFVWMYISIDALISS